MRLFYLFVLTIERFFTLSWFALPDFYGEWKKQQADRIEGVLNPRSQAVKEFVPEAEVRSFKG